MNKIYWEFEAYAISEHVQYFIPLDVVEIFIQIMSDENVTDKNRLRAINKNWLNLGVNYSSFCSEEGQVSRGKVEGIESKKRIHFVSWGI